MEPKELKSIPFPYEIDECPEQQAAHHRRPPGPSVPTFFRNIKQDDIILILLIILLLSEGSECDYLLVGILIFIFLAGFDGNFLGI